MSKQWDPTDCKYEWSIKKELLEMTNRGRFRELLWFEFRALWCTIQRYQYGDVPT